MATEPDGGSRHTAARRRDATYAGAVQSREMEGSRAPSPTGQRRGHESDRWAWRHRIRANPRAYRWYRLGVAVLGVLLILLGAATGWLPGPGGIPLVLLGLAVLASEFEWAHRLLHWARVRAHHLGEWARRQPRWLRWSGGLATLAGVLAAAWLALAVVGLPGWLPGQVTAVLTTLPGVDF
jgi:hypothetical protein